MHQNSQKVYNSPNKLNIIYLIGKCSHCWYQYLTIDNLKSYIIKEEHINYSIHHSIKPFQTYIKYNWLDLYLLNSFNLQTQHIFYYPVEKILTNNPNIWSLE